eukprot:Seg517.1 transcript_id=Seg517.1/GoldUCD/mRNA.D3Y31 product="5-hydroxytryptamine receptor 1E" protein_id=Seg517.1/GoldUCD/D3Y31
MECSILPAIRTMASPVIYILVIINAVTSVTNVLINFCFIKGIFSKERLKTPTNLFVVSLAVSDFLVGLISQPLMCVHLLLNRSTIRSCAIAYLTYFALGIFCGVSGLFLPVISLDRFIRMRKLQYYTKYVTKRRAVIVILAIWANAIAMALSPLYNVPRDFFYGVLLAYLCIISIIMSFSYTFVITKSIKAIGPMKKRQRTSLTSMNSVGTTTTVAPATMTTTSTTATTPTNHRVLRSEWRPTAESMQLRITITVAILVAVVIVSWVPCFIVGIIWASDIPASDENSVIVTMRYLTITIGFASSSVNPLLYCWRIRDVRKAALATFRSIFRCKIC